MKKLLCIILLILCLMASVSHSQSFKMFGQLLNLGHWSTDGLVFYWRGIEAVEAVDESLYGNHGTLYGPTWAGNGLDFDGTNDHVETAMVSFIFNVLTPHAVTAWIHPTISQDGAIWSFGQTTGLQYLSGLFIQGSNDELWWVNNVLPTGAASGLIIPLNQWSYVAFSKDATGVTFCLNGEIVFVANTSSLVIDDNQRHTIGRAYQNGALANDLFKGFIADVKIYNRALSASEIAALYINPDLPMQQDPIWMFQPPPAVVTGQVIIITKHEKKSTIMSILSALWEGIWLLV